MQLKRTVLALALIAAVMVPRVGHAQRDARAYLRESLRRHYTDAQVLRYFGIRSGEISRTEGVDITWALVAPRRSNDDDPGMFLVLMRNNGNTEVCVRIKLTLGANPLHTVEATAANDANLLLRQEQEVPALFTLMRSNGDYFEPPMFGISPVYWTPAPSGERRCSSVAPPDLDGWIASTYESYDEYLRAQRP